MFKYMNKHWNIENLILSFLLVFQIIFCEKLGKTKKLG